MDFHLPLLLDGATGTNLSAAGMPEGICVEKWILDHPDKMISLEQAFVEAGSHAVLVPTFGANREKLKSYGLSDEVERMNIALTELSRKAVDGKAYVGGDLSPTGQFVKPFGDADFAEIVDIYRQQAAALKKAGVDFIHCETIMSLTDARAMLLAAKKTGLPVFITITVNENGRTLSGLNFKAALITLQAMGADAVGLNCSEGPLFMLEPIKEAAPYAKVPMIAKPNAGRPDNIIAPEEFAKQCSLLIDAGARIIGGCCGSTPAHIAALRRMLDQKMIPELPPQEDVLAAAGESEVYFLNEEDIVLSEPVQCGIDIGDDLIEADRDTVSAILVRINTVEEVDDLIENAHLARLPIAISTDSEDVLEKTLFYFQGRAIIDSASEIDESIINALAKKYGAIIY